MSEHCIALRSDGSMAYLIALGLMVPVCGFSLLLALRVETRAKLWLRVLEQRVEQHAQEHWSPPPPVAHSPDEGELRLPLGDNVRALAQDVEALIDEVFQDKNSELSRAALEQLLGYGVSTKEQCATARRGLLRVPSFSAVAVSIFVLASVGFDGTALRFVLGTLGLGVITAGLCQLVLGRARRAGQAFVEFVQMMERELHRAPRTAGVS